MRLFLLPLIVVLLGTTAVSAEPTSAPVDNLDKQKSMRMQVLAAMRTCQIAAESYASDHNSNYPSSASDEVFRSYYPAGSNGKEPTRPGIPFTNPFTGKPTWPIDGKVTDVETARNATPGMIGPGVIEYSVIFDNKHNPLSYAIRGGGADGRAVAPGEGGRGKTIVLSNK